MGPVARGLGPIADDACLSGQAADIIRRPCTGYDLYTDADFCLISCMVAGADCVLSRRLIGLGTSNGSAAKDQQFIRLIIFLPIHGYRALYPCSQTLMIFLAIRVCSYDIHQDRCSRR